ncbi:MAG: AarF/ABC1/UbiB kinase family protein [Planctomycetes bacterium]|nr:AarF/ABC1/UbiB kinase family protein [Planctomycetota bacterium]
MSILGIAKTYRRLNRLVEIVRVLARHGFGHYVHRLNLHHSVPGVAGVLSEIRSRLAPGTVGEPEEQLNRRISLALQDLGPTFVKLGQMLSTRPDLVSEDLVRELRRLQDQVEPFPSDRAVEIVEREIGTAVTQAFAFFDPRPFASGSMAQAHHARLQDGTELVVKVKRPDIEERVILDLGWLRYLADLAEKYIPELQPYRPVSIVEELDRAMRRELDFVVEASFTAKFQELFSGDPTICTPRVYWELTTSHVLALERIQGRNISAVVQEEGSPAVRRRLAQALAGAFCRQYFEFGAFHADPHPGNLLVSPDGRLGLVDFGMVGHLSEDLKRNLARLLIALDRKELDIFCELFGELGATTELTNPSELQADLLELLDKYYSMPLRRIDTVNVFSDVTRIARRNGIVLPRDVILLAKSFVAVMTTARNLDPDFDFAAAVAPHVRALAVERMSPKAIFREAKSSLWHLGRLLRWLPRELSEILRKAESGRLQIIFRHVGLDPWVNELDRSLNRLSMSIIIAAIVIGSSLLLQSGAGPMVVGVSVLGLLGFVVAGLLGLALVVAIWRSGRI